VGLICNSLVVSSNLTAGSIFKPCFCGAFFGSK
jgi:hypothetical protein